MRVLLSRSASCSKLLLFTQNVMIIERKLESSMSSCEDIKKLPAKAGEYYFENGFRKVVPYFAVDEVPLRSPYHLHRQTLMEIFSDSKMKSVLRHNARHSLENYGELVFCTGRFKISNKRSQIRSKITVNGSYVFQEGDRLWHLNHIHEGEVLDSPLQILHNSDNIVVICKPCSIPVHDTHNFRLNTVLSILEREHNIGNLKMCHRLDILTSGLLILPKNKATVVRIADQIKQRTVSKEYLCLVKGQFPRVICDVPIKTQFAHTGCSVVCSTGLPARTVFELLGSNKNGTSIVKCYPETGRTHQIRVHLQYMGHPIVDDPIYNNPKIFGRKNEKDGSTGMSSSKLRRAIKSYKPGHTGFRNCEAVDYSDNLPIVSAGEYLSLASKATPEYDPYCVYCHSPRADLSSQSLTMHLHCLKYRGPDWEFTTPLPNWAYD